MRLRPETRCLLGALLACGLAPSRAQGEEPLDRRLGRALAGLETRVEAPAAGPSRASHAAEALAGRRSLSSEWAVFRGLLRDLEQREAAQQRAFERQAAKGRDGATASRIAEARAADEDSHGRLLRIIRELVAALEALSKGGTPRGDVAALQREAREIVDRLEEYSRPEPISAGDLKVRAPQLKPAPLAETGAAPARPRTEIAAGEAAPGGEETIPQALKDAASSLAGPVEVYEWVRNHLRSEFYHGLMKGPLQTYLEGSGNDADTASLLIALLGAKDVPARFAHGTVELTGAALVSITGAGTVEAAVRVLERAGIPHETVVGGGTVSAVRLHRVWVEAYVPYDNYRGTVLDPRGKIWVPLDAGFKPLGPPAGLDVVRELGLDARALLDEYLSAPRSATPLEFVRERVGQLLAAQRPGTSYADVLNVRTLVSESLGILPGVLPYKLLGTPEVGSALPDGLLHRLRIVGATDQGQTILDATYLSSDLLGKRLTLAYVPETAYDEQVVKRYGGLLLTPPYLVNVRPVLRSRGIPLVAGSAIRLGVRYTLRIEVETPGGTEVITNTAIAGNLAALGLGGREVTGSERHDDTAGEILSDLAWRYLDRWNASDEELANLFHVVPVRPTLSVCLVMSDLAVQYWNPSAPYHIDWKGLLIDADLRATAPAGIGGRDNERPFVLLSGLEGSILENRIFEDRHGLASVSTAKALQLAREQHIPIRDYVGNADAIDVLPLDPAVKAEVHDAVARGLLARVPDRNVVYLDWSGVGYLLLDEETGEAAYQLQGGHSGGSTAVPPSDVPQDIRDPLVKQGEAPAPEGTEAFKIEKFGSTDFQEGTVNKALRPFKVLVTDVDGRPIPNAPVTFQVTGGGGLLTDPILGRGASEVVALSNANGEAEAVLTLGKKTSEIPRFILLDGDEHYTQVGLNLVTARSGAAVLAAPFSSFGYPDDQSDVDGQRHATLQLLLGSGWWWEVSNLRAAALFIMVSVSDPYGNPISNLPVRLAYWPDPIPADPPPGMQRTRDPNTNPGTLLSQEDLQRCSQGQLNIFHDECEGEKTELILGSTTLGVTAFPIPGDSPFSYYVYAIGTPEAPYQIPAFYETWGPLCSGDCTWAYVPQSMSGMVSRRILVNSNAQLIEAYPTRGSADLLWETAGLFEKELIIKETDDQGKDHFHARGKNEWHWLRLTDSELTLSPVTPDTNVLPRTAESLGNGRYRANMIMGATPQLNVITNAAKIFPWIIPFLEDGSGDVDPAYVIDNGDGTYSLRERIKKPTEFGIIGGRFSLWGIKPEVVAFNPSPVLLTPNFVVDRPSFVSERVLPLGYEPLLDPRQVQFELRKAEELVIFRNGLGPYELYKGLPLSPITHTAEVKVFGVSTNPPANSVNSDRVPIPVCHLLELETPQVEMRRVRDPLNGAICDEPGDIKFNTCRASSITLFLKDQVMVASLDGAPAAPLENLSLAPGEHVVHLDPDLLGDFGGRAAFKIQAVDTAEPTLTAEAVGEIESSIRNRSVLPIGHTFVKGVDLFDGHMVQQSSDLKLQGRHLGIEVTRTYSSVGHDAEGLLGAGWAFNYTSVLTQEKCGLVNVTTPDGGSQVFRSLDGGTTFTPQKGYHTRLVHNADQSYDFFDKSGNRHHFREPENPARPDGNRRLDYIEEPHGDRIVLTYDGQARLSKVAEVQPERGEVRALAITYTKAGGFDRIDTLSVAALSLQVKYRYDDQGNLTSVTRAGSNIAGPTVDDRVEKYEYSATDFRDRHQMLAAVDPNGDRTEWVYYKKEELFPGESPTFIVEDKEEFVKEVHEFPNTGQGFVRTQFQFDYTQVLSKQQYRSTVQDARGNQTLYLMNGNGSPVEIDEPLGKVTKMEWATADIFKTKEIDPLGRVTDYGYDALGNLTSEQIVTADFGVVETSYVYDQTYSKLTQKTDAEGRVMRYDIDPASGDLRSMTDAAGNLTQYRYDSSGNGLLVESTDPRGHKTSYSDHDTFGNPRRLLDPLGNTVAKEYDARGRLTRQTDSFGRELRTVYDGLDRPTTVTRVAGGDSGDEVTQTEYYPNGEPKSVTNPLGSKTTYTLDGLKRVTDTETSLGADGVLRTNTQYDAVGNKTRETDRRQVTRQLRYDELNRLKDVTILSGPAANPGGVVETCGYDLAGNKLFETNLAGLRTDFDYDGLYRVKKTLLPEFGPNGRYVEEYTYDKVGNKKQVKDANGNPTSFDYDGLNRVVTRTDALGHIVTFEYDDPEGSHVNKSQEHDTTRGLRTTFAYDALNRELERKVYLEGAGSNGEVYPTLTRYDDRQHAMVLTDPRGTDTRMVLNGLDKPILQVVDPGRLDLTTTIRYDGLGDKKHVVDPRQQPTDYDYDVIGRLKTVTDARSKQATVSYDGGGLKLTETDRRGVTKHFTYDNVGRLLTSRIDGSISGVPWTQQTQYDDRGRTRTVTDARNHQTVSRLDGLDRVVRVTDALNRSVISTWDGVDKRSETDRRGHTTSFDYDALNRLVRTRDPAPFEAQTFETTYDDAGNRRIEKDRRGTQKTTQLDPLGRLLSVTRAGVTLETNAYDGNGNKTSARDGEGKETRFSYGAANRLASRTDGFGTPVAATTTFAYDENGNQTEERDQRSADLGEAFSLKRTYDALNRLETVTDGEQHVTTYGYDEEGNRTFVKQPLGQETRFGYDELGKLLSVTQPSVSAGVPVTRYVYDAIRNRTRQTDANGHAVQMEYDELDRLATFTQDPGGLSLATTHHYDESGNETLLTDPKGQQVRSTYDELNRLKTKAYAFAAGDSFRPFRHTTGIVYEYDPNGNVVQVDESVASGTDPPGVVLRTTRDYDPIDRLTGETTTLPEGGTRSVGYTYFDNGTRQTVTDPGGLETSYLYDGKNRLQTTTTVAGPTQYTYWPDDLLKTIAYPNGVTASYGYDKADRLTSLVNANSATPVSSYGYSYDANGNRLTQSEANGGLDESTSYGYDDLDRVTSIRYPNDSRFPDGRVVSYGYDLVGNREHETETTPAGDPIAEKQGVFDALNRLTALNDLRDGSQSTTFTWDANGNQTSKTTAGLTTGYRYDVRDKLVEVGQGASVLGLYQYDYQGRRTKKVGDGAITQYVYDQTSTLNEYDESGQLVAKYDYGSDRLISLFRTDEPRKFFSFDGLRSVSNLTSDAGGTVASYHLDAWGNYRFPTELDVSKNRFGFTGYLWDPSTSLYYAKARFFDPQIGRFLTQDSELGQIDDPPSIHRYFYANDNPIRYIDPTGHETKPADQNDNGWAAAEAEARNAREEREREIQKLPEDQRDAARQRMKRHDDEEWEKLKRYWDAKAQSDAKVAQEPQPASKPSLLDRALGTLGDILGYIPRKAREFADDAANAVLREALGANKPQGSLSQEEIALGRDADLLAKNRLKKVQEGLAEHGGYGVGITVQAAAEIAQAEVGGKALEKTAEELQAARGLLREGEAAGEGVAASERTAGFTTHTSPTGLKVTVDEAGAPVRWEYKVGQKGERGAGYLEKEVSEGMHRGHVKAVNEGAGVNAVDDSALNAVEQHPTVNLSNVKRFENWRVKNAQGAEVVVERLPNGYIRTQIPSKGIDVTYDPLSRNRFQEDWFLKGGTHK